MRKLALVALLGLPLCSGCLLTGDRAHTGWSLHIDHPSSVDTNMPVLVQNGSGLTTAHPVGSVAGPVTSGDFTHGPMQQMAPIPLPRSGAAIGTCDPCDPKCGPPRLTVQEYKEMAQTISGTPSPTAPTKNTQ